MYGKIHSIETFGTVDGPGIRFVVFMQGCPMRCLYCHNPDTWDTSVGEEIGADEILRRYDRYRNFLKNGGLTVTGGEPLGQIDFVTELFRRAKEKNIHTCLDTSGITFSPNMREKFDALIENTDLVMLDIKHIDDAEHKKLTGRSNAPVAEFAEYLDEKNAPVWIRHVLVPGITDGEKHLKELGSFIGGLKNVKALDVLPYHDMGKGKYEALGLDYPLKDTAPATKEEARRAREIILRAISEKRR